MRSQEEKTKIQEENTLKKIITAEIIGKLQERLKESIAIEKTNPADDQIIQYQGGRQTELHYCIHLLLTPIEKVKLGKSKNPRRFLLSSARKKIR